MNLIPRHETCRDGCRARSATCERGVCLMTFAASGAPVVEPPPPNPHLERLARVKACPHRTPEAGCGCAGGATCSLGKGRAGFVAIGECLECVGGIRTDR